MDAVQLPQGHRVTMRRFFTKIFPEIPGNR